MLYHDEPWWATKVITAVSVIKVKGKGTLLVTYTVYSEIWSLHLTRPWGAVGSHSAAPGDQLQILSQYLSQGCWLEINLTYMFWQWGGTRTLGGNPHNTQHTHIERPFPRRESNTGLTYYEVTVLTTWYSTLFMSSMISVIQEPTHTW